MAFAAHRLLDEAKWASCVVAVARMDASRPHCAHRPEPIRRSPACLPVLHPAERRWFSPYYEPTHNRCADTKPLGRDFA